MKLTMNLTFLFVAISSTLSGVDGGHLRKISQDIDPQSDHAAVLSLDSTDMLTDTWIDNGCPPGWICCKWANDFNCISCIQRGNPCNVDALDSTDMLKDTWFLDCDP